MNKKSGLYFIVEESCSVKNNDMKILSEDVNSDNRVNKIKVRSLLQDTKLNQNRRIYDRPVLEEIVAQMSPKVSRRSALMEVNHPFYSSDQEEFKRRVMNIDIKNCGSLLTKIYIDEGNKIIGEFETISGFLGPDVRDTILDKIDIGFSLRMAGKVVPHPNLENVNKVTKDLTVVTYDLVTNPSHKDAKVISFCNEDFNCIGMYDMNSKYLDSDSTVNEQMLCESLNLPTPSTELIEITIKKLIRENVDNYKKPFFFNLKKI